MLLFAMTTRASYNRTCLPSPLPSTVPVDSSDNSRGTISTTTRRRFYDFLENDSAVRLSDSTQAASGSMARPGEALQRRTGDTPVARETPSNTRRSRLAERRSAAGTARTGGNPSTQPTRRDARAGGSQQTTGDRVAAGRELISPCVRAKDGERRRRVLMRWRGSQEMSERNVRFRHCGL